MNQRHYKKELAAFVNHEFSKNDQQEIAKHLLQCGDCRAAHDRLKIGALLAGQLRRSDAPAYLWNEIENALDGKRAPQMTLIPQASYFGIRNLAGYAVAVLLVSGFVSIAYLTLFRADADQTTKTAVTHDERPLLPDVAVLPANTPVNPEQQPSNTNTAVVPDVSSPALASVPSWQFDAISGTPKVGAASSADRLAVGDFLETDDASRARITIANIGNVEIGPNSRVKLVGTTVKEHRLSLEHGVLQARISAPPRLFIVDTPSAAAVDLGCEYKLEVDKAGNSKLTVMLGFVALERGGRESIVPAGAICVTKRGKGLGTPFSADSSVEFQAALTRFDFEGAGSRAVREMLARRKFYDMVTLWHLLSRVPRSDRESVYDALSEYVKPPADTTREGILKLNKTMLGAWRVEVERVWFE